MADETISGGRELDAFLQTLAIKVEKNILRSGLRAGANKFKEGAKAGVPVRDGVLRQSIRVASGAKGGTVFAYVKAGSKKAWYWRFVEFGTSAHVIVGKRSGLMRVGGHFVRTVNHPGARARPFLRPAFDAKASAALVAIGAQIRARLTKEGINVPAPFIP